MNRAKLNKFNDPKALVIRTYQNQSMNATICVQVGKINRHREAARRKIVQTDIDY